MKIGLEQKNFQKYLKLINIKKKIGSFNFGRSDKKIFYDCLK